MEEAGQRQEQNWLELMTGYLNWRIIPPDVISPFAPVISYPIMCQLAEDKEALLHLCHVKCFCDGFEVLHIKDLRSPMFCTDHPSLTTLAPEAIFEYMRVQGVLDRVALELEELQTMIKEKVKELDELMKKEPAKFVDRLLNQARNKDLKPKTGAGVFKYRRLNR